MKTRVSLKYFVNDCRFNHLQIGISNVLESVFGVSKEAGCVFFNKVVRLIVSNFYDKHVKLPAIGRMGIRSSWIH